MAVREVFKTLKIGDKGAMVHKAQQLLAKRGSKITANGVYTIGMRSAVAAFQKKNNLKVTGELDRRTWDKLNEKVVAKKAPAKKAPVKKAPEKK